MLMTASEGSVPFATSSSWTTASVTADHALRHRGAGSALVRTRSYDLPSPPFVLHRRAVIEQIQGDAGGVHPELSTVVPSFRHVASNLDVSELLPSTFSLRSVLPYFRTVFYDSTKTHTKI